MEPVIDKSNLLWYIDDLVRSFEISLLDIFNKFFYDYNYEVERVDEFTIIGIKGHLKSRQEENIVISTMWFEYAILKEPYSQRKEANEVQWQSILDKEINYKGTLKQLEDNFDGIIKKLNKFDFFAPKDSLDYLPEVAEIEIDVKIGSKFFHRSSK